MEKRLFAGICTMMLAGLANAQTHVDTTHVRELQEVTVTSLRAGSKTPIAYKNLDRTQIQTVNFGKDVPSLLSTLPSVTTTTDAGNGIGYTSVRVRGTDA